jgi:hypothetical protein
LEKDSKNLRLLVSLWDERGGSPWQPFYRGAKGWPAHVASAPKLYLKGVVVELKREIVDGKGGNEGEGGWPATNLWPTGHAWPPLNPYFYPPLHFAPIMLSPLTKSSKTKANSFHPFLEFFLFYFIEFFYIMQ